MPLILPASAGSTDMVKPGPQLKSGWYSAPLGETDTVALTVGNMLAVPFPINRAVTVTKIGVEVTGTGASSTVRLGIYSDAGDAPGSLLVDAGSIDGTSTAFQEITISQALTVGKVWLAACAQGSNTVTVRGCRYVATAAVPSSGYSPYSSYALRQSATSTAGAFPASAPTFDDVRATAPRILLAVA